MKPALTLPKYTFMLYLRYLHFACKLNGIPYPRTTESPTLE